MPQVSTSPSSSKSTSASAVLAPTFAFHPDNFQCRKVPAPPAPGPSRSTREAQSMEEKKTKQNNNDEKNNDELLNDPMAFWNAWSQQARCDNVTLHGMTIMNIIMIMLMISLKKTYFL